MSSWDPRLHEVFLAASELSDQESIEHYLDEKCGEDDNLRGDVESLLRASDAAGEFLEEPIERSFMAQVSTSIHERAVGIGSTVDRYRLLEEIGEGGFGIVYMAEQQEPVRRRVALKVLKHGMDTREIVARFEAERQAIAMMTHPNIASVLDAGTTSDGRPYFVMDLVNGVPVTDFCNEAELPIPARLKLFGTICDAIQHAHQKGVIHRDIKPSNVLVTMHGDQPVPIVIDFGIAKAIDQPLTTRTLFTRFGQMVGTPQYMSPEQSGISGIDVDTRSDVYSLGVILYELLTGSTPLGSDRIKEAAAGKIAKLIQEEDPPTPSVRLSRLGKRLPLVCQQRGSDVRRLPQLLRGDLDWIVMKALEKDRNRRYGSAARLSDDIRRLSENEPVEARRPTTFYRLSKFAQRKKLQFALAAIFTLGLVAGLIGTTFAWLDAAQAREEEQVQREAAEQSEVVLKQSLYDSLIARAEMTYRSGKRSAVRRLLEQCPVELRGWEWQQLQLRTVPRKFTQVPNIGPRGDEAEVITLNKSRYANKIIATNTSTNEVRTVYETDSSTPLDSGHHCPAAEIFAGIAFDKEGPRVMVFDLAKNEVRWRSESTSNGYDNVTVCTDGSTVAVTHNFGSIRVFSAEDGTELAEFFPEDRGYVALSSDGTLIAQSAEIWNTKTRQRVQVLDDDDNFINSISFSPHGTRIAKAGLTGNITLWDVATGKKLQEFVGHDGWVASLAFSSDGSRLVSGGSDTSVRMWDVETGRQVAFIGTHDDVVHNVSFSRFDSKIVSWSSVTGYRQWSLDPDDSITLPHWAIGAFQTNAKDLIGTVGWHGDIRYWNWQTGLLSKVVFADSAGFVEAATHRNGRWLATANTDGVVTLRDLRTGRVLRELNGSTGRIEQLKFAHATNLLVGAGNDSWIWNAETGELVQQFPELTGRFTSHVAITPDGKYFAAKWKKVNGEPRACIRIMAVDTGSEVATIPQSPTYITSIEFIQLAPDSTGKTELKLVAALQNSDLQIWDVFTGEQDKTLTGRSTWFVDVEFNPEANRLFTSSVNQQLGVWNLKTNQQVTTIHAHRKPFNIFLNVDRDTVITCSADQTVKLWESHSQPPTVLEQRNRVTRAQKLVGKLTKQGFHSEGLVSEIDSKPGVDQPIRELAKQIASVHGDNPFALGRECRLALNTEGLDKASISAVIPKARRATSSLPDSLFCRTTLAMALYANGEFESALEYLDDLKLAQDPATSSITQSLNESKLQDLYRILVNKKLEPQQHAAADSTRARALFQSLSKTSLAAYTQVARRELNLDQPSRQ